MVGDPTQDPRDVAEHGLTEARDDSDPGPDSDYEAFAAEETARMRREIDPDCHDDDALPQPSGDYTTMRAAFDNAWRDRFDTREEYEEGQR